MVGVIVKWGKQQFDVEIDTSESVEVFKAQLFALTSVPIERQKIMGVKGGQLKDDAKWDTLGLKPGQKLMLMGTADVLAAPPPTATVFAEDLPPEEVEAAAATNPAGLANLGNTCYLNSSLQCMRAIPEIGTSLQKYTGASSGDTGAFIMALRQLNAELDRSNSAKEVKPFQFVSTFRTTYPMFAQQNEGGRGFMQQDAEECWSTLVSALANHMQLPSGSEASDLPSAPGAALPRMEALRKNLGDVLFGIEMESTYRCVETEAEEPFTLREAKRTIQCYISDKTAHLYSAVETSLEEHVEKASATLGRDAQYERKSRIARLPPYLAVQFVRFDYRKDTGKRAKILRAVSFPTMLDIRNLCTDKLKAGIGAHNSTLETEIGRVAPAPSAAPAAASSTPMEEDTAKDVDMSVIEGAGYDNKTGRYELFAIITHQGRTAEGGHYVAWIKKDAKTWLVFDDETVAEFPADRIKELHGGGDWHMAYVCFYRKMDSLSLD